MDTLFDALHKLFAYDAWANREALASLAKARVVTPRALRWMAHTLATERLWLGRLKEDPTPLAAWPELSLEQCRAEAVAVPRLWQSYLDRMIPEGLTQSVAYTNTKGESWANDVQDILLHVVLHSAHHRGQIASDLRAAGSTPATTDFIHCVREGCLEGEERR